jgi:hypothetical protein
MYHNQENIDFPLREQFLNELKSYSGSDVSEIYRHLFTCMESESLESTLNYLKDAVKNESWFFDFHKSMRQTDFYDDVFVVYKVDVRTNEERERMDGLRKILPMYPVSNAVKTEEAVELGLESEMKEFRDLNRKSMVEKRRSIGGNLDMVLWNLIHLDKDNFLQKFIQNFFKEQ